MIIYVKKLLSPWRKRKKTVKMDYYMQNKMPNYSLSLFRLGGGVGGGGGVGAFDATQDLNPLLLTNDCVYSVPTS